MFPSTTKNFRINKQKRYRHYVKPTQNILPLHPDIFEVTEKNRNMHSPKRTSTRVKSSDRPVHVVRHVSESDFYHFYT